MKLLKLAGVAVLVLFAACRGEEAEEEQAEAESFDSLTSQDAVYDPIFGAPKCAAVGIACRSAATLIGRGLYDPGSEAHTPNTIYNSCTDGWMTTWFDPISLDALSVATVDGTNLAQGKQVRITASVNAYGTYDYLDLYSAVDAIVPEWIYVGTIQASGTGPAQMEMSYTLPRGTLLQAIRGNHRFDGGWGRPPSICTGDMFDDADDLIFAVDPSSAGGDVTPPAVAISQPAPNAIIQGTVVIGANATDATGVTEVRFLDGASPIAVDTTSPYTTSLDTTLILDGSHILIARAFDAAGNVASVRSTVFVDNQAPNVGISIPFNNSEVHGVVSINAWANDVVGVDRVELRADGALIGTDSTFPYYVSWDTAGLSGPHQLVARAVDRVGHSADSSPYTVIVDNTAPTVQLTAPAFGAVISGTIDVTAAASDNRSLQRVELYAGGELITTISSAPFTARWDTTRFIDGPYLLNARAFDAAGNMTASAGRNVTVDNPFDAVYDSTLRAPRCSNVQPSCDSTGAARGRASVALERNQPNTINASCADGTSPASVSLDRISVRTISGGNFATGQRVSVAVWAWAYASGVSSQKLDLYYTADANNPSWTFIATLTAAVPGLNFFSAEYVLPAGSVQAVRGQFRYGGSASACTTTSDFNDRDDLIFAVAP